MSGRLTTHVLDTARGRPAEGVAVALRRGGELVAQAVTNADGRTGAPLLEGAGLVAGVYEITFAVGAYFARDGGFLDEVPVRFTVSDPSAHLHVPLLVSPWSYTTYRGS
jgi:5-hydroxyisourate hydrolase